MFRKKTKPEPEPFVPHHYVYVRYAGDLAFRSKYYETRGEAEMMRDAIVAGVKLDEWIEIDGSIIRSNMVRSISIEKTRRPYVRDLGWG